MAFADRREAGRALGARLVEIGAVPAAVLALPRGGVPVAAEVARALGAPLDVLVVRKLGHPRQPELGVGAIGEGGNVFIDHRAAAQLGIAAAEMDEVRAREAAEVERRVERYREGRPRTPVRGAAVVLVDDGLATGSTARAGIGLLRAAGAARIVLAVPVGPRDAIAELAAIADEVVCLEVPRRFRAVGQWYDDFTQVPDAEVIDLLATAQGPGCAPPGTDR